MKYIKIWLLLLEEKKTQTVLFLLILLVFAITRFAFLGRVPAGIHVDEAGAAYDAQCIANYGVDRYLTKFPPYLKNYGGGQSVLYAYTAALLIKVFGFSIQLFRAVAGIYSLMACISLFFLGKLVFKDEKYALIAPFLMTVMPEFLMSERWGLDCNLFLSLIMISIFALVKAIKSGSKAVYFFAGLLFGLTLYTYAISYVILPLFLLLALLYLIYIKEVRAVNAVLLAIPFILLGIPLLLEQLVNSGIIQEFSTPFMDFFRMDFYRGGEFSLNNISENLRSLWSLFSHDQLSYNAKGLFGTVYYISLPFIVIGLVLCVQRAFISIRRKSFDFSVILLLYFLVAFAVILVIEDININRANYFYAALIMLASAGIAYFWSKNRMSVVVILPLYLICFLAFGIYYFTGGYNADTTPAATGGMFQRRDLGEAVKYLDEKYDGQAKIWVIANDAVEWHIIIAAMNATSPYEFEKEGYAEGNYEIGVPKDLDISGKSAYVIGKDNHHITDYLATVGFVVDDGRYEKYSLVYKE